MALVSFYLAGNYYVVREGNAMLNSLSESVQIVYAPIFYFFSGIIPALYIFFGLRNHDRRLLIIGILVAAFSIFTYQIYFSTLPTEIELVLLGAILIAFSIVAIKKLNPEKFKITSEPIGTNKHKDLEALLVNQAIIQPGQGSSQTQFGGGNFGGGGAGGAYLELIYEN